MKCKLLQKRSTGQTRECSKHLQHIAIEKDIFSELNICIFQISLKCIKLVLPKILFILVLCNFNFTSNKQFLPPPPPAKTFLTFLPSPPQDMKIKHILLPPKVWEGFFLKKNYGGMFYMGSNIRQCKEGKNVSQMHLLVI